MTFYGVIRLLVCWVRTRKRLASHASVPAAMSETGEVQHDSPQSPAAGPQIQISDSASAIITANAHGRLLANGVRVIGYCWFECGDVATGNIGNKRYPKFACGPCTQALRALNLQCRGDPAMKAYWTNIRDNEQTLYKRKVISARVRPPGSASAGVSDKAAQNAAISEYVQSVDTEMTVNTRIPVYWMLEDEYVGYHVSKKAKTKDEAQAMWDAAKDNPDIRSSGSGASKRVAVLGIVSTEASQGQAYRRKVNTSSAMETEAARDTANQRLLFKQQNVDFERDFGSVGGSVFRRGAHSGMMPQLEYTTDQASPELFISLRDLKSNQLQPAPAPVDMETAPAEANTPRTQRRRTHARTHRHGSDMARTWLRHGWDMAHICVPHVAQAWLRHGSDMSQTCLRHGSDMDRTWLGHGPYMCFTRGASMAQTWLRHVADIVRTWLIYVCHRWGKHGSDMAQTCLRHVSDMAQTWLRHGSCVPHVAQAWLRHGSDMAQTWL